MDTPWTHTTVLLNEAVAALFDGLAVPAQPPRLFVDATFGRGGHSRALLARMAPTDRLLAFDRDPQAVAAAAQIADARFSVQHQAFAQGLAALQPGSVAGVLLDIGVSSPQIDDPARGFSFRHEGPLDMRMDPTRGQSAAQWLAAADTHGIAEVIRDYGEERFAVPIAKAIVARRQERGPVATTTELAQLVAGAVKTREPGKDPATRTFQALRIFINAELEELQQALSACLHALQPQGRMAVISFHSLEDRLVKQFIARHAREVVDRRAPGWMLGQAAQLPLKSLGRVKPGAAEVDGNPRARSAVMRVAERTVAEVTP